ncbi:MAG TPA: hypothetical protein VFF15_01285 [Flavobacteriaceae bacterium]|nr:hypothetical protein [Flavobacteriaceae bacterium]
MKRTLLPLRIIIIKGLAAGFFFAAVMSIFDYLEKTAFSWKRFLIHFVSYGLFWAIAFRYKYTKEE